MSVNINADTTNGLVLTSDTTGELKLQSAGADIATVDSTGITMASGKAISGAGAGGKVLQVVQGLHTTQFTTTSNSFVDVTGFNATITPSSTSSKILVMVTALSGHNASAQTMAIKLLRDSTDLTWLASSGAYLASSTFLNEVGYGTNYLDSPATTSATTYKIQLASGTSGQTVYMSSGSSTQSTITLMEIAE
jgi:hypothetical protein